jgi:hypothetical protein
MAWYECAVVVHHEGRNIEADNAIEAETLMEEYIYGDFAQGKVDFEINVVELVRINEN